MILFGRTMFLESKDALNCVHFSVRKCRHMGLQSFHLGEPCFSTQRML